MRRPVGESLSSSVLKMIHEYVRSHDLQCGDKLPTERELAEEFGVSRATVRDALRVMETCGTLSRRPKSGCIIQPVDLTTLAETSGAMLFRSASDFKDLSVARLLFEVMLLPLVVDNAKEEDFQQMDAANQQMETTIERFGYCDESDSSFHSSLVEATGNKVLIQMGILIQEYFRSARPHTMVNQMGDQQSLDEHKKLVSHLRSGKVLEAQRLLHQHLGRIV